MAPKDNITAQFACDTALLHDPATLFPPVPDSVELTIDCSPADFSASRIARAIEDCDAHLINLNVTSTRRPDGNLAILIRAGLRNPDSAIRALERYGYHVDAVHSPLAHEADSLRDRIDELFTHINL